MSTSKSTNSTDNAQSKAAMERFKTECAADVGVTLNKGDNGNLTSREAGSIGGEMVRRMVKQQEEMMK